MVFPLLSTLVLLLIAFGLWKRRKPGIHMPVMFLAFCIDLGMVLWLEFNRAAVEQVVEGVSGLLAFHVVVSTLVVILYILLIWSGIRMWKNKPLSPKFHRNLGMAFVVGRLINYVTAYFVGSA